MATTIRLASPAKLWRSYLAALDANPIRTKVATSTTLFVTGDIICQLGIERRQLGLEDRIRDAGVIKDVRNLYDVSVCLNRFGAWRTGTDEDKPYRTIRMGLCESHDLQASQLRPDD
jgi:hypothetical protein